MSNTGETYEQRLITNLAQGALKEQRARRRWGIFFKVIFFAYVIGITVLIFSDSGGRGDSSGGGQHAAVIDIQGIIFADSENSAEYVNHQLRRAFRNDQAKGVILRINSPGGSAVESNRIYKEIRRLRGEYSDKKVYAVAGDFCASGGYFIAAAADEIYADEASLIGSIGVIFSSFGFVEVMDKLGIERRVITAGTSKNMLDPFSPQSPREVVVLENILADIHTVFIAAVKEGRGAALTTEDDSIFSGKIFSGSDSVRLGLADGINSVGGVARDIIGVENIVYYREPDFFKDVVDSISSRLNTGGIRAELR